MMKTPERFRLREGTFATSSEDGNNGVFVIPNGMNIMTIIASDGEGWEHVSVSCPSFTPSWGEMCYVKSLFWDDEDMVIQYHPKKSEYVNNHPYCLHLWRPIGQEIPTPPRCLVGLK